MKIEALVELIRTIGASVQQLSSLVEGMPKAVDDKLASMRDSVLAEIRQVRAEASSMRRDFADVQSDCGAVRALLDTTMTGMREIIADNRAEISRDLETVRGNLESLDNRIVEVGNALNEARENTLSTFNEVEHRIGVAEAATKEVRSACDTTNLHHAVKKLEAAVATGEEGHLQLAGKVDGMLGEFTVQINGVNSFAQDLAKQISDNESIVLAWRTEDTARVQTLETKVDTVDKTIVAAEQRVTEQLEGMFGNFSTQIGGLRSRTAEISTQLVENHEAVTNWRNEDVARVQTLETKLDTVSAGYQEAVRQVAGQVEEHVVGFKASLSQLAVDVSVVRESALLASQEHVELGTELRQGIKAAAGNVDARVNELTETIAAVTGRVGTVEQAVKNVEDDLKAVDFVPRADIEQMISAKAESTISRLTNVFDSNITEIRMQVSSGDEALSQRIAALPTVEQIVAAVPVEITRADVQQLCSGVEQVALTAVAEARAAFGQQVEGVSERVLSLEENAIKYVAASEQVQRAVEEVLQTHTAQLANVPTREEMDAGIEATRQNMLSSITAATVETQAARSALTQCRDTLPKLEEMLEIVGKSVSQKELETAIGSVRDHANSRFADFSVWVTTVADTVMGLSERIETLPAPFDPEPLKEWVGEQFKTLPLPELHFDVAAPEGDQTAITFTFGVGDKLVTKQVELGIGVKYRGVYDRDEEYEIANLVTHKGSMWYAKAKPTGEPGKDANGWQLAVKCGRDGKDAPAVRSLKALRDPNTGLASEYRLNYDPEPPEDDPTT